MTNQESVSCARQSCGKRPVLTPCWIYFFDFNLTFLLLCITVIYVCHRYELTLNIKLESIAVRLTENRPYLPVKKKLTLLFCKTDSLLSSLSIRLFAAISSCTFLSGSIKNYGIEPPRWCGVKFSYCAISTSMSSSNFIICASGSVMTSLTLYPIF